MREKRLQGSAEDGEKTPPPPSHRRFRVILEEGFRSSTTTDIICTVVSTTATINTNENMYNMLHSLQRADFLSANMGQISTYIIDLLTAMVVGMLRMASSILSSSATSKSDALSIMSSMSCSSNWRIVPYMVFLWLCFRWRVLAALFAADSKIDKK